MRIRRRNRPASWIEGRLRSDRSRAKQTRYSIVRRYAVHLLGIGAAIIAVAWLQHLFWNKQVSLLGRAESKRAHLVREKLSKPVKRHPNSRNKPKNRRRNKRLEDQQENNNSNRTNEPLRLQDLSSLNDDSFKYYQTDETYEEAYQARGPIMDLLHQAGLRIHDEVLHRLPRWSQVTELYGDEPVVLGMETCQRFRDQVPREMRYVGVAGQMNVGTNALGKYLLSNLKIEENKARSRGMLSQVPWNKHGWVSMRFEYNQSSASIDPSLVLPVVVVRDAYTWMHSLCESPYPAIKWQHDASHCPNLVSENAADPLQPDAGLAVSIRYKWGKEFVREWKSLAHVWSDWYRAYYESASSFPRLLVRFEDLLFHTPKVLQQIRQCAGADWKTDRFVFHTDPAKDRPYFTKYKQQGGMVLAMIRYGQDKGRRTRNMTQADIDYAREYLDPELMKLFHYTHPSIP